MEIQPPASVGEVLLQDLPARGRTRRVVRRLALVLDLIPVAACRSQGTQGNQNTGGDQRYPGLPEADPEAATRRTACGG